MSMTAIRLRLGESTLTAVPSVHYRVAFAFEVNRLFCGAIETPDAVAVELGDIAAQSARRWIAELCGPRDHPARLPVMLGLTCKNRRIRASRREEALRLQRETGSELDDLPPEILRDRLGFHGEHALFLSPTDSIVEAIRCSWEHNVPLYGVDLDEVADDIRDREIIVDPWLARGDLSVYIQQRMEVADRGFDSDTDPRRELAMAARLKALLQKHTNMLFVCGLAHWARIRGLLLDPGLRPAVMNAKPLPPAVGELRRIVVHPVLAVTALDLWPALAGLYENRRAAAGAASGPLSITRKKASEVLNRQLHKAYRRFCHDDKRRWRAADLERVTVFEQFVQNLCLVSGRCLPDLPLLLSGARSVMSSAFLEQLERVLMDFPWANPKQFPYPVLAPQSDGHGGILCTFEGEEAFAGTQPFYVRAGPNHTTPIRLNDWSRILPKEWRAAPSPYSHHTWGPWDYLVSGLSIRALHMAQRKVVAGASEVFVGGQLARVDLKATLRSFIRGEGDVFVFNPVRQRRTEPLPVVDFDPVVWILGDTPDSRARWAVYSVSMASMARHVMDRRSFMANRERRGDTVVCVLGYGPDLDLKKLGIQETRISAQRFDGLILYQPICWKVSQFARWVESTQYGKNPFGSSVQELYASLPSSLQRLCGLLPEDDWRTTLIVLALPFAQSRVVFVSKETYVPPLEVTAAAAERGVELVRISRDLFDAGQLERLKVNYLTPLQQLEPDFAYPQWVEQAIGESQYLYRELMPDEWLHFGEDL